MAGTLCRETNISQWFGANPLGEMKWFFLLRSLHSGSSPTARQVHKPVLLMCWRVSPSRAYFPIRCPQSGGEASSLSFSLWFLPHRRSHSTVPSLLPFSLFLRCGSEAASRNPHPGQTVRVPLFRVPSGVAWASRWAYSLAVMQLFIQMFGVLLRGLLGTQK